MYDQVGSVIASSLVVQTVSASRIFNLHRDDYVFQNGEDGGDQLSVRAQAAAVEAPRARPHQGNHAKGQLQGTLPGEIQQIWNMTMT